MSYVNHGKQYFDEYDFFKSAFEVKETPSVVVEIIMSGFISLRGRQICLWEILEFEAALRESPARCRRVNGYELILDTD